MVGSLAEAKTKVNDRYPTAIFSEEYPDVDIGCGKQVGTLIYAHDRRECVAIIREQT
jgi:hypothetical protein